MEALTAIHKLAVHNTCLLAPIMRDCKSCGFNPDKLIKSDQNKPVNQDTQKEQITHETIM